MKKYICILAFGLLALGGCRRSSMTPEEAGKNLGNEVSFTAASAQFVTRATDSALENGDQVGIFALEPVSRVNVKAAVNGNKLVPETPIKWGLRQRVENRFIAYLPYSASLSSPELAFSVQSDQSQWSGYAASDLRLSIVDAEPENEVHFLFQHVLCKLIVVTSGAKVQSITTADQVLVGASVDLASSQVEVTSLKNTIQLGKAVSGNGGEGYVCILPPQSGLFPLKVKTSDGRTINCTLEKPATFESGFAYRADIEIPGQGTKDVTFKVNVVDWADDGTLSFQKTRF